MVDQVVTDPKLIEELNASQKNQLTMDSKGVSREPVTDPKLIEEFRISISNWAHSSGGIPDPILTIDDYVPLSEISQGLVNDIGRLSPFGAGNPPLTLVCKNMVLAKYSELSKNWRIGLSRFIAVILQSSMHLMD